MNRHIVQAILYFFGILTTIYNIFLKDLLMLYSYLMERNRYINVIAVFALFCLGFFFLRAHLMEHNRYMNLIGIMTILSICYAFSQNKKAINYRIIMHALTLQFVIAFLVLKVNVGRWLLSLVAGGVACIYQFADVGSRFVFGHLLDSGPDGSIIFAFKVLPVIIFFGSFTAVLFHFDIIQKAVKAISVVIQPLLGTSGAETLCAIANSFLGQTEAPLLVRDYLKTMTKSEMLVVMVSGMGTISGAILVVFAAMGVPAPHMLAASAMAIPSTIMIAKILYPQSEETADAGADVEFSAKTKNVFDAISQGTVDGLQLALNVAAMLISFIALLAMLDFVLGYAGIKINDVLQLIGFPLLPDLSVANIFSYLFAPFGYLLGFTGQTALDVGQLIGIKVSVNELVAYGKMMKMTLPQRAIDITTYALCGFSNFSCIGIQIGGIGALVPEKRQWLTELGLYAVLGGALSNLLSAMMAGLLL